MYYIIFLRYKDPTEYTGIESEISAKVKMEDISWFPILKAMSVEHEGSEDDFISDVAGKLTNAGKRMNSIPKILDRVLEKDNKIE